VRIDVSSLAWLGHFIGNTMGIVAGLTRSQSRVRSNSIASRHEGAVSRFFIWVDSALSKTKAIQEILGD
jgi:hypothetical protein